MKELIIATCMLAFATGIARADDRMDMDMSMPMSTPGPAMSSTMSGDMSRADPEKMPSTIDLTAPMTRAGSGTSWMPDSTALFAAMWSQDKDMEMAHGALFARYIDIGSQRGNTRLAFPGWAMYMRNHPLSANSQLGFRAMLTPDPLTVGGSGYPLLFQTGETWRGRPLHDAQHPHDLISELAVSYSQRLGARHSGFVYFGYPGEPALGPPTYMHRPIAYDYDAAPIAHHWQDATHVSFGVLTAGLSSDKFRLEGSTFTGSEPNEVRTNFDALHLDSASGRISWNPNRSLATQVSYGFIRQPEAAHPGEDVRRFTASIMHQRPFGRRGSWSNTLVYGANATSQQQRSQSWLYETDYRLLNNSYFARVERVGKSPEELALPIGLGTAPFPITQSVLGMVHNLPAHEGGLVSGVGADLTYSIKPAALNLAYGAGNPLGFEVFYRIRPSQLPGQR